MKAIISGGGTGGHIYPALAVANHLLAEGWDILYVGAGNSLEEKIMDRKNIDFKAISVAPIPRKPGLKLPAAVIKGTAGFFQSLRAIRKFKPDIILGTGGYVAGPVVLAGCFCRTKTLIHEQNAFPGLTNRILARFVDRVALNFSEAANFLPQKKKDKYVLTGNPVREKIYKTTRREGLKKLNLADNKITLLTFGGSQGAESINQAMIDVCQYMGGESGVQIIFVTGKNKYDSVLEQLGKTEKETNIIVKPYLYNIEYAYAVADLVISRAGATGLAEITACGIPAILIPYPHASGNHQHYNARVLEDNEAALLLPDKELCGELLLEKIIELINNRPLLQEMKKNSKQLGKNDALNRLVAEIKDLI